MFLAFYTGNVTRLSAGLLLFTLTLFAAEKKPVTIDALMAQKHIAQPTPLWQPGGERFAIVNQDQLDLYQASTGQSKEWFKLSPLTRKAHHVVTQPAASPWRNRRVSQNSYQWSDDGKSLLAEVDGDLFLVHLNGRSNQLTRTDIDEEDPKLSPDGTHVLYRSKSNLYSLDVASKQVTALTKDGTATLWNGQLDWVYPEELELGTASWWSPDSKKVAFMQFDVSREFIYPQADLLGERAQAEPERYPQAGTPNAQVRVGVIDIASGNITWMDLGDTSNSLLARVIWMPDSETVAVERLSRLQNKLELIFCNADKGSGQTILKEESKTWINFTDNFFPLHSASEFLWTSESSGFCHIYRYSNKGDLLAKVTQGEWEVRGVSAVDEAHHRVFFVSSEASPLETQLYSADFGGSSRKRITTEPGSHVIHANSDGSAFLDSFSNFDQPPQTILKNGSGATLHVLVPADYGISEEYTLLPSEVIQMKDADGETLYGRLIKPLHFQSSLRYPLIVEVYGGPGVQEVRNQWYGMTWSQLMAQKGYLVFQLDNHGSRGRGHSFEEPVFHELGTREVADQKTGVEYLLKQGLADSRRVGITGWSYGGYMTIHSMLLAPEIFSVGVAGAPVTNWHNYDTIYTERYMGLPADNAAHYDVASNTKNAGKLRGKLLILHNIEDDNVLFQNTMQMAEALESADRPFQMQLFPQKTHGVSGPLRRPLIEAMTAFFEEHLKPNQD